MVMGGRRWATHLEVTRCRGTPRDRDRDGQKPVGSWSQEAQAGETRRHRRLETEGLAHLSTAAPSDWLKRGQVPLPAEGSASGPTRAGVRSRSL